jgi:hypothetical protein
MTQEGITEGMKGTMEDIRDWKESVEESSRVRSEALEQRLTQMENAKPGLRRGNGLKPTCPETFSRDRSIGKEWIQTILHYMDLRPQDFPSDATRIGWTLSFFKEGRANSFAQEAHGNKWK